jgi:predicted HAD superfamily Cof-like phosphohydrolase
MYQIDVKKFMDACEQPSDVGMKSAQANLYMDLIKEEWQETIDGFEKGDIVEVADGLADMVWVILGMANTLNIPFDDVWREVKASNMSKCVDGKVIKNEAGKVMKPDTYFKPNLNKIVRGSKD